MKTLRLILGDQLNQSHSWFQQVRDDNHYVMMEIRPEATYVRHHIQKVAGFFAAMRRFARHLEEQGHSITYLAFDDESNRHDFEKNVRRLLEKTGARRFQYQLPDEFRLDEQFRGWTASLSIEAEAVDSEHFMTSRDELGRFFEGKKTYVMEPFYREIRRRFDLLMEGEKPRGGQWNYDAENRSALPEDTPLPETAAISHDLSDIVKMIRQEEIQTIGEINESDFRWPLCREEALFVLQHFLDHSLKNFGRYQDAMTSDEPFLFHSRLSFAFNLKMISPLEVVQKTINYWETEKQTIDIAQVEGFVRQIIGWREYMRGIYWATMPEFEQLNFFGHKRELPDWFWTGETKMQCLSQAIGQSLRQSYAHHIQRLMITGNFANLAGIHPDQVDEWYLGIYIDAIQWVEITNTRGMSQFADGGITATKPYVSSANYIRKMSNYCSSCDYDPRSRHGENACPFNSLYWAYFEKHRDKLEGNPRIGMAYHHLKRMDSEKKKKILDQAQTYLNRLESL